MEKGWKGVGQTHAEMKRRKRVGEGGLKRIRERTKGEERGGQRAKVTI